MRHAPTTALTGIALLLLLVPRVLASDAGRLGVVE
jgi:hypothetical protein